MVATWRKKTVKPREKINASGKKELNVNFKKTKCMFINKSNKRYLELTIADIKQELKAQYPGNILTAYGKCDMKIIYIYDTYILYIRLHSLKMWPSSSLRMKRPWSRLGRVIPLNGFSRVISACGGLLGVKNVVTTE